MCIYVARIGCHVCAQTPRGANKGKPIIIKGNPSSSRENHIMKGNSSKVVLDCMGENP